jgi:hypothetical protein
MKNRTILAVAISSLMTASPALAAYHVNAPEADWSPTTARKHAGFFQVHPTLFGSKIVSDPLKGFGRDMQIQDALPIIFGHRWRTYYGGVDPRMTVSWRSEGTKGETLNRLGKDYRIVIEVDWKKKVVYVYKAGFGGTMETFNPGQRQKVFESHPSLSLKANIENWGKQSHVWTVEWRSKWNAVVHVRQKFGTDFKKAIISAIDAANKDGDLHFVIDFYPNHVVVIGDRS